MFSKFTAIVANTFTETIRQPIYNILVWVAAFWVAFVAPALAGFTLQIGNDIKVMMDVGLATLLLFALLSSVFSATGVITREIESQTVLTVVSKPVSRTLFIFGKYVGVMIATLVGFYMVAVIFILAARHGTIETVSDPYDQPVWVFGLSALGLSLLVAGFGNFFYGWNFFTSLTFWAVPLLTIALAIVLCVSPDWELQHPFMATDPDRAERLHLLLQLLYAIIMMFGAALILTAFAVALSTRFSQIVTLMLCAGIMMLGLLSDYYFGTRQDGGLIFQMLYGLVPNFQVFWVGDAITQEQEIPWAIVTETAGYACCYSLAILALGVALFQTREVG